MYFNKLYYIQNVYFKIYTFWVTLTLTQLVTERVQIKFMTVRLLLPRRHNDSPPLANDGSVCHFCIGSFEPDVKRLMASSVLSTCARYGSHRHHSWRFTPCFMTCYDCSPRPLVRMSHRSIQDLPFATKHFVQWASSSKKGSHVLCRLQLLTHVETRAHAIQRVWVCLRDRLQEDICKYSCGNKSRAS